LLSVSEFFSQAAGYQGDEKGNLSDETLKEVRQEDYRGRMSRAASGAISGIGGQNLLLRVTERCRVEQTHSGTQPIG